MGGVPLGGMEQAAVAHVRHLLHRVLILAQAQIQLLRPVIVSGCIAAFRPAVIGFQGSLGCILIFSQALKELGGGGIVLLQQILLRLAVAQAAPGQPHLLQTLRRILIVGQHGKLRLRQIVVAVLECPVGILIPGLQSQTGGILVSAQFLVDGNGLQEVPLLSLGSGLHIGDFQPNLGCPLLGVGIIAQSGKGLLRLIVSAGSQMDLRLLIAHLLRPFPGIAVAGQGLKGSLGLVVFSHGQQRFRIGVAGGLDPLIGVAVISQSMKRRCGLLIFPLGQQLLRPGVAHLLDPVFGVVVVPQGLEGGDGLLKPALRQQLLRLGVLGLPAAL